MASVDFETNRHGNVAVVAPTGELDLAGARTLEVELGRLLGEPGLGAVVLDLRGLAFIDSSGLRLVVVTHLRARQGGRRFALVRGSETVHRVFEITRMDENLEFVADPGEVAAGPTRIERKLAATPQAATEARHALDGLAIGLPDGRVRDVRLLVSELVTNAVRHAELATGDVIRLVVDLGGDAVRVEVHDPGRGFMPVAPEPDPTRPSGWGLYLVAELSDRWGVQSGEQTLVWFELDGPAAAA